MLVCSHLSIIRCSLFYILSVIFVSPPTLTMMHLCITQCTYSPPPLPFTSQKYWRANSNFREKLRNAWAFLKYWGCAPGLPPKVLKPMESVIDDRYHRHENCASPLASQTLRLLSCLYLNCPCLRLLSHRLFQFPSGWSSKGLSFSYSVCSKRCC